MFCVLVFREALELGVKTSSLPALSHPRGLNHEIAAYLNDFRWNFICSLSRLV